MWPDIPNIVKKHIYRTVISGTVNPLAELGADVTVAPFRLCHDNVNSTAFIISAPDAQLVFFSDTGPSTGAAACDWKAHVAEVVNHADLRRLRAIVIETSFTNDTPAEKLYGHLRPKDVITILEDFKQRQGGSDAKLEKLTVVIQHVKPGFDLGIENADPHTTIMEQLLIGAQVAGL